MNKRTLRERAMRWAEKHTAACDHYTIPLEFERAWMAGYKAGRRDAG